MTKDRPGYLRSRGRASKTPGKTFVGTLVVDDATEQPDFLMRFYAPREEDTPADNKPPEVADTVHEVIAALPEHTVPSRGALYAEMRRAGHQIRERDIRDAVEDLIVAGRLLEARGKHGPTGYQGCPNLSARAVTSCTSAVRSARRPPMRADLTG